MTKREYNRVMVVEIPVQVPEEIPEEYRSEWVYNYQEEILGNTRLTADNVLDVRPYND